MACGCQPSETVAADNQTDENPGCDCIEVQHDNPVLTEDVLLVEHPFGESATRADGEQWAYTSFDTEVDVSGAPLLYIVAAGNDAFSPSSSTGQQLLHTWPTSDGQWTPAPNPVQMPWELHGSRFGYFTSAVRVSKVRANSATVLASNATRFRVASNVLIVPIQAILVLPEYPKPEYEAIMRATFGAEEQEVLWDDRAKRQRITRPGGLLSQIQGQWTHRSKTFQSAEVERRAGNTFALPDDVFDACGIQFRLMSVHEIRVNKELFELYRLDGRAEKPICDKFPGIQNRMFQLDAKARAQPGVRGDLPRVLFNWTVQPAVCNDIEPLVDVACDPEDSGCTDAGFVVVGLENLGVKNKRLVISHELGHVLSLAHRSDSACTAGDFLMCGKVGSLSAEFEDKAAECAEAREWALKYRDAYLDGGN